MRAPDFLKAGLGHMDDRAATYDKPEGERSMGVTVALANVLLGDKLRLPLSEEDGWNFMELLKLVRSKQGLFRADNYEDRAAYAGLAGEAAFAERSESHSDLQELPEGWSIQIELKKGASVVALYDPMGTHLETEDGHTFAEAISNAIKLAEALDIEYRDEAKRHD